MSPKFFRCPCGVTLLNHPPAIAVHRSSNAHRQRLAALELDKGFVAAVGAGIGMGRRRTKEATKGLSVVDTVIAAVIAAAAVSAAERQAHALRQVQDGLLAVKSVVARRRASLKAQPPAVSTCSILTQAIFTVPRTALIPGSTLDRLVECMDEWRTNFVAQREEFGHSTFWHRTSNKVVLCVLALQIDGNLEFVRGCNLEVSLPSGSLCSERNAFGTALTTYPFLRREHFVGIAVLSLTEGDANLNPLPPCGVCSAWIEKIHEVNQEFRVIMFSGVDLKQVHITTLSPLAAALSAIRDCETENTEDHRLSEAVQLTLNYNEGWQSPARR